MGMFVIETPFHESFLHLFGRIDRDKVFLLIGNSLQTIHPVVSGMLLAIDSIIPRGPALFSARHELGITMNQCHIVLVSEGGQNSFLLPRGILQHFMRLVTVRGKDDGVELFLGAICKNESPPPHLLHTPSLSGFGWRKARLPSPHTASTHRRQSAKDDESSCPEKPWLCQKRMRVCAGKAEIRSGGLDQTAAAIGERYHLRKSSPYPRFSTYSGQGAARVLRVLQLRQRLLH